MARIVTKLLGGLALGRGRVMLTSAAAGRSRARRIKRGEILDGDRVFRASTTSVIHLLRASPILVGSRHRAYIVEGLDAPVFLQSLGN